MQHKGMKEMYLINFVDYALLFPLFLNKKQFLSWGWSGGVKMLRKLSVPGRPTIWIIVGQGPNALAVGAGGGCLDIFTLTCLFSPVSLSLGDGPI